MSQDEKTAGQRRGVPVARSTAPAGTPYPVAPPSPAPMVPVPTASQPRTVGGHTARLVVPEEEARAFDSFAASSVPVVVHDGPPISPPPAVPSLSAEPPVTAKQGPPKPAAGDQGKAPPPSPPAATTLDPPGSTRSAPLREENEGSTFLARLFAPVSVAVGLVFFAMGSMIGLTMEGRLIRLSITTSIAPASAPPSASSVSSPPVHIDPVPPVPPPPSTQAPAPASAVVSAVVGVIPSAAPSAKPPVAPGVRPPPGPTQTTKRPPLPFP